MDPIGSVLSFQYSLGSCHSFTMSISTLLLLAPSLFASGFAKPIAVEQTKTTEALTCEGKIAGSTFSFSTSSGSYDILCGTDYWGGDLTS